MWCVILLIALVHASPVSVQVELESTNLVNNTKKEFSVDLSQEWQSLEGGSSKIVVLSRASQGKPSGMELLILDRENPSRVLASPTIELKDSAQTRARFKLETGDWVSIRLSKNQ